LLFYFQQIADREGYRIVVFQSFESEIKETVYLKSICDGSIDGAILITSTKNNFFYKDYTIPVSTVFITQALSQEELNEYCVQIFEKLLTKIA
jgi:LacI family transcriptional regulator